MKKIRKVFAIIVGMAMLLSSVTVFAAEEPPGKAPNPTWRDVLAILDYVNDRVDSGEYIFYSDSDDVESMIKHLPEGQKLASSEKEDARVNMAKDYYWGHEPDDLSEQLTGDAATYYNAMYDACMAVINSFRTATGVCYYEDLRPRLDALENQIATLRNKIGNGIEIIADDAEEPESGEWIRQSDWDTFIATVDGIYSNQYPQGSWDDVTRQQVENLIELFSDALNTVKEKGNFTLETSAVTPSTSTETTNGIGSGASAAYAAGTANDTTEAYATTSAVKGIESTISGVFIVKKVNGVAFTTPMNDVAAGYGLASGEKVFVKVLDLDPKKSYLAQAVIDNAAAAIGAETGPALNIEIGKMDAAGRYSLLSQDGSEITVKVGIPANFAQTGKTYAVVCVRLGGAYSYLKDLDADPDTITFTTTGGLGAYAIVKY